MTEESPQFDDADIEQITEQRRTDHGVSIETEIKRGTGTRDQDKITLKAKGATFEEAKHFHNDGLDYLDGGDDSDAPVLERVRNFQPEVDDD